MESRLPITLVAVLVVAGAACSSTDSPPDSGMSGPCWKDLGPNAPPGEVELGAGVDMFEPLAADAPLELIRGPQGGHHFTVRSRIRGMNSKADTFFTAFLEDGSRIDLYRCPFEIPYDVAEAGGFFGMKRGSINLIVSETFVPRLPGSRVRIHVEVADADGRFATDERFIVAFAVPRDAGAPAEDGGDAGGGAGD